MTNPQENRGMGYFLGTVVAVVLAAGAFVLVASICAKLIRWALS